LRVTCDEVLSNVVDEILGGRILYFVG